MASRARAVVFEDDDANYDRLASTLGPIARDTDTEIVRFPGDEQWDATKGAGDLTRLVREYVGDPRPASLVILDWDLTKYRQPVTSGLVREQCDDQEIPVCVYRTFGGDVGKARRLRRWQDGEIALDSSKPPEVLGAICGACLRGFLAIEAGFTETRRLADVVKKVLKPPSSAEVQLDQYAWGNPEVLRVVEHDQQARFAATQLGYWIYNRLLQFPGVLLNPVAAASYLGIDHEAFVARAEVQEPFRTALYEGPFAETGPYWWTSALDDVRASHSTNDDRTMPDGRSVLERLKRPVGAARCFQGHDGAGFYCIITGQPVCEEHSVQPTGWLPIGADLSRIEQGRYQELSAWLAL